MLSLHGMTECKLQLRARLLRFSATTLFSHSVAARARKALVSGQSKAHMGRKFCFRAAQNSPARRGAAALYRGSASGLQNVWQFFNFDSAGFFIRFTKMVNRFQFHPTTAFALLSCVRIGCLTLSDPYS